MKTGDSSRYFGNTGYIGFCDYGLSGQSGFSDPNPLDEPPLMATSNFTSYVINSNLCWSLYPINYGPVMTKLCFATAWPLYKAEIHLI